MSLKILILLYNIIKSLCIYYLLINYLNIVI